jgi:hypothetical protein
LAPKPSVYLAGKPVDVTFSELLPLDRIAIYEALALLDSKLSSTPENYWMSQSAMEHRVRALKLRLQGRLIILRQ